MVVVCKNPNVKMSIMVEKSVWPTIVSEISRLSLSYKTETAVKDRWVVVGDIFGKPHIMASFLAFLDHLNGDLKQDGGKEAKIYILFNSKKGVKKHAKKNREETGSRSKGGNSGDAGEHSGHGQDSGVDGSGTMDRDDSNAIDVHSEETDSANDNCN